MTSSLKEYERHILDTLVENTSGEKVSLCGVDITTMWVFLSVSHAFNTCRQKGRLQPCPACVDVILETFWARGS